jgi:hypothetical protein
VPSEFVSWIIQHVGVTLGASIVVANYSVVALRDTLLWNQGARDDRWHAAGSVELALRSVCGVHCQSDAQWHTENMTRTANICARADSYVPAPAAGA